MANVPDSSRGSRTREEILDAAYVFLETHPFRDLTVGELMQRTSVSRPAFYQYFRDRYDIVDGLIDRIMLAVAESGLHELAERADEPEVCKEAMRHLAAALAPSGYAVKAIVDACAADERVDALWSAKFLNGINIFGAQIVAREQAAGRTAAELDPEVTAKALTAAAIGSICHFFRTPNPSPELVSGVGEVWARMWAGTLYGEVSGPQS